MEVPSASVWSSLKYYLNLLRLSLLYQFKEFFHNSTLHGVRFIAEEGRPFLERFMWFLFTATGTISALVIITSLWEKFQTNPTITGLDTNFQTTNMYFPTVLVCPEEPFDDAAVNDVAVHILSGQGDDIAVDYENFLRQLASLTLSNVGEVYGTVANISGDGGVSLLEQQKLRNLMFLIGIKCKDVFEFCSFKDEDLECCDIFSPIYMERGFCYGFNLKYVYPESGYDFLEKNTNVFELLETDKKWALTIYPKATSKIYIHSQLETSGLEMASPPVAWNTDHSIDMLVTMKQTITTNDTQQLSVGQRKCLFPGELQLDFFLHEEYTFSNCMIECRMKLSLKFCGCVLPFYATVYSPEVTINYCRLVDFKCLQKYSENVTNVKECSQCELSCQNIVYEIDKLSKSDTTEDGDGTGPYVNIEYLTWPIIRYKREVLFGWVDLLVSFGGIAGLFLGFSLLSGVEIVYFFTLRALCMMYKEEHVLVEIDRKKREKPLEDFYLGLKLKKNIGKKEIIHHSTKKSKLLIFDGTPKPIPPFVLTQTGRLPYTSRAWETIQSPPYHRKNRIIVRSRPEDVPIFPYLP